MVAAGLQQIDPGLAEAVHHTVDLEGDTAAAAAAAAAAGLAEAGLRGRTEELPEMKFGQYSITSGFAPLVSRM